MWRSFLLLCGVWMMGCGSRSSMETSAGGAAGGGANGGAGAAETVGSGGTGGTGAGGAGVGASGGSGGSGGGLALSIPEACVVAASCGAPGGWTDFTAGACIDGFARLGWRFDSPASLPDPALAQRLLDCAQKAEGECKAFHACFGGDWVSLSRCREGGACFENMMGDPSQGSSFDCGSLGATCFDLWSGAQRACCNAEPCSQTTAVECDGTVATWCGGWGERVTFDCGPSGRKCDAGSSDLWNPCVGDAPCDPMSPITCEGDVAVYCSAGGLAKHDCSTTGFRTACNGGASSSEPACRPAGSACDPQWDASSCAGTAMRVCADGEWVDVDCAAVGFGKCEVTLDVARCVPVPE